MAMTGGAWAQLAKVHQSLAMPVPACLSWAQAAATPISFVTAHDALASAARLAPGESVLVRGASSAAGLAAIQVARYSVPARYTGPRIARPRFPSSSGWAVAESCPARTAWRIIRQLTGAAGVEVVIDIVGAGSVQDNIDAAAVKGRIVCLGGLAGTEGRFNLDEFSRKRIQMIGVTFRTRTFEERAVAVTRFREEMLGSLSSGELQPVIDRSFSFREIEEAQRYMREKRNFGKVIVEMEPPWGGSGKGKAI